MPKHAPKRESPETRGYSLREMRAIEKEISERNAEWLERFDMYIENMALDTEIAPEEIIARATKLADLRLQTLLLRQGNYE